MVRATKVALWVVVLTVAGGLFVTAVGIAEPYLTPGDLPLSPQQAVPVSFGVVVLGIAGSSLLDTIAWRRMGARAGLSPEGFVELYSKPPEGNRKFLASPPLSGTIHGRQVRVRTYKTGGGKHSSLKTFTVVETDLDSPVEWTAMLAPASGAELEHMASVETDEEHWTAIDDEFAYWGAVPEETVQDVLSGRVREMLRTLGSGVAVGDVGQEILNQFAAAIPDDADGASATIASGVLDMAGADDDAGPTRRVSHKGRGLLLDAEELERRAEAVAAVAEAVERTSSR